MAQHGKWKRLGDGSLPTEDFQDGLGHIVPVAMYNKVFFALICLTGLTVWAAQHDFGVLNIVIAIFIASIKAALVTLFFMHLTWERRMLWVIVIYPSFIFLLLLLSTLGDSTIKKIPTPSFNYNGNASASVAMDQTAPTEGKAAHHE